MGLAASQARLLFITSRQNDVSAQMQRVSNQNMILARDEDEVSEKYNRMLSGTTYETTGGVNLSYDALMGAGAASSGAGAIITESSTGRVVLSKSLAASLLGAGAAATGSSADFKAMYGDAKTFAAKVSGSSDVANAVEKIQQNGTNKNNNNNTTTISINGILSMLGGGTTTTIKEIDASGNKTIKYGNPTAGQALFGDNKHHDVAAVFNQLIGGDYTKVSTSGNTVWGMWGHKIDADGVDRGQETTNNSFDVGSKSIKELYENADQYSTSLYLGSVKCKKWDDTPDYSTAISNFKSFVNGVGVALIDQLSAMGLNKDVVTTTVNTQAQQLTKTWTTTKNDSADFYKQRGQALGRDWNDRGFRNNEDSLGAATMACKGVVGITCASNTDSESALGDHTIDFACDAGLFVKTLIDSVVATITDGACKSDTASGDAQYDRTTAYTVSTKYLTVETNGSPNTDPADTLTNQANYYINLYNQLATSGWTTDETVTDSSTLTEKLKNNTYYINGRTASNSGMFKEKTDSNATAKAEAYWKTEMQKIQRKEKQLETQMTKLQTEFSSLTNDINSVKSILDANIQKSFTYCQNG